MAELVPPLKDYNVKFTSKEQMVSSFKTEDMYNQFAGMQPGDFTDIAISLKNEHEQTTDWYMTNEVLKTLEDTREAAALSGGAYTYILTYKNSKTGEEKLGLINKKSTEGDWSEWSDNLPSQFLSKQSKALAEQQLGLAIKDRKDEFDSIMAIDNPTIKKHFLNSFADDCDGAAVNLKAAAMPGQKYHVIVPINNQKDTEIYAPNYPDGTKLALVRYPHGGIFEIPVVTVNNKNAMAKKLLGADAPDVVGITSKVAEQLSGADYDGDTVMCIPTDYGKTRISRSEPLKDLVGFDNKLEYGTQKRVRIDKDGNEVEEYFNSRGEKVPIMTKKMVGRQMGEISNLITDMTLDGGATESELARAVKHSMVVIDAEKHKLDYKRSEVENNIQALKERYQRSVREDGTIHVGGASTIISKAKGVEYVNKRRGQARIDPQTGELTYLDALPSDLYYAKSKFDKKTNTQTYYTTDGQKIVFNKSDREAYKKYNPVVKVDKKTGEVRVTNKDGDIEYEFETRTQKSTKMAETKDAYSLLSDARHPIELVYADYANTMKAMANQARKEMLAAGNLKHDPQATKIYQSEVDGLMARLNEVEKNRVRMREADRRTDAEIKRRVKEYEENDKEVDAKTLRKWKQQGVTKYRQEVGAQTRKERNINISDREWEAIQAGAISENKLKRILANSDMDALRDRATPREKRALSDSKINRIRTMNLSGKYTLAEIAAQLGVSTTTVKKYLKGVE
jgi:DNA-binding CsgD family transcriptional regulator